MDVIVVYCSGERLGSDALGRAKDQPHERVTVASWTREQPDGQWMVASVDGVAPEVEYRHAGDDHNVALDQRRGARMWSSARPDRTYDVRRDKGIYTWQAMRCPECGLSPQEHGLGFRDDLFSPWAAADSVAPVLTDAGQRRWDIPLAVIASERFRRR